MTLTVLACFLFSCTAARAAHSRGYMLAVKLNRALASTPMRGTGFALVTEGKRFDVNPAFIAAAAGKESSYGAAMCEPFNAWGLGSCGRAWRPPRFGSWRESIRFFARWYRSRYAGDDMWAAGRSYCPPCGDSWGEGVAYRMRLLGFAPSTRYPRG